MNYFAKYLPVKGEIKEDDFYISGRDGKIYKKHHLLKTDSSDKKVKLFLCSRDIQVGDKFRLPGDYIALADNLYGPDVICSSISEKVFHFAEPTALGGKVHGGVFKESNPFKILGEISPDATWVKEGDEFEEYEEWWWNPNVGAMIMKRLRDEAIDNKWLKEDQLSAVCKVKCPNCNHFH